MLGTKILESRKSKFNGTLNVLRTWGMGTYIQAGGLTQSGGIVESIWRSTLSKIYDSRFKIQSVLILGLGGGTVAKLIRKNYPNVKITGVDIDPIIVELGKKYLALSNSKTEIIIADAFNIPNHLDFPNVKFDLIIVDLYQGDQFPKKFESKNYIHLVRLHLTSRGVVIFNRLYFKDEKAETEKFGEKLKKIFKKVEYYHPPANLMFICYNI